MGIDPKLSKRSIQRKYVTKKARIADAIAAADRSFAFRFSTSVGPTRFSFIIAMLPDAT
jgi:hypothetical protein